MQFIPYEHAMGSSRWKSILSIAVVALALLSGSSIAQTAPPPLAISPILARLDQLTGFISNSPFKAKLESLRKLSKKNRKRIMTAEDAASARANNQFPGANFPSPYEKALAGTSADQPGDGTQGGTFSPGWSKNQLIVFTGDPCFNRDVEGQLLKDAEIWSSIITAESCANSPSFKLTLAAVILAHELMHTTQSRSSSESKDTGECEAACFEKRFVNELIASNNLNSVEAHCLNSWCVAAECRIMNHCVTASCATFPWNQ